MIVYIIFIVVGCMLLPVAYAMLKNRVPFLRNGVKVKGTVIELVEKTDEEGTFYFPVFNIPGPGRETHL